MLLDTLSAHEPQLLSNDDVFFKRSLPVKLMVTVLPELAITVMPTPCLMELAATPVKVELQRLA